MFRIAGGDEIPNFGILLALCTVQNNFNFCTQNLLHIYMWNWFKTHCDLKFDLGNIWIEMYSVQADKPRPTSSLNIYV